MMGLVIDCLVDFTIITVQLLSDADGLRVHTFNVTVVYIGHLTS